MKSIVFVCIIGLFVSGCLQNKNEGTKPPVTNQTQILGLVSMEDMHGDLEGGLIYGLFTQKNASANLRGNRVLAQLRSASREMKCKFIPAKRENQRQLALLDVGKITFGTEGKGDQFEVTRQEDNSYIEKLESDFPTGRYDVIVGGTDAIRGFKASLFVPEQIEEVQFGEARPEDEVISVNLDEEMKVSWKAPFSMDEYNAILFDLLVTTESGKEELICGVKEDSLTIEGGRLSFNVSQSLLNNFSQSEEAKLYLMRAQLVQAKGGDLKFEGLRSWFQKAKTIR